MGTTILIATHDNYIWSSFNHPRLHLKISIFSAFRRRLILMSNRSASATALLPPRNMAGPALLAVTLVMTFLACLALGAPCCRSRRRPLADACHQCVSIQIVETRNQTADDQLPAVLRELSATPVSPISGCWTRTSLSGSGAVARRAISQPICHCRC